MIKIPKISVRIESEPTTDRYLRAHARAIDNTLDNTGNWQNTQPNYFIGFNARKFTYEEEVDVSPGRHSIEYAASGYVPNYAWHTKVYINDQLIAEGDVGRKTHLKKYFMVGPLALKVLPLLGVIPIIRPTVKPASTPTPTIKTSIKTY